MKRRALISSFLIAFVFAGIPTYSSAQSTIVTRICNDVDGATITITSPVSDSLINESTVTVTGSVTQSNQLEVFVDDAFNGVVSLDSSVSSYSTLIQLPIGTHKITITAVDACQVKNASQSIVVTYQSAQAPSTGSEVPTGISDGDVIGSPQSVSNSAADKTPDTVFERFITPVFNNVVDALDLQSSGPAGVTSSGLTNMSRFLMTTAGLIIVFTANQVTSAISTWSIRGKDNVMKRRPKANRRTIRAIGIVLILLVFIL
jgi:hypothetical protein